MGRSELKAVLLAGVVFALFFFLPAEAPRFTGALAESAALARDYAREHVILCLLPALFIAGAISVFVSSASVLRYLGPSANRVLSYGVASVSGSVLAVCSCTVLPLFAGIYKMGAGLGPASAFLYSGPAINILAIVLTARVLGTEIGIARAVGAVVFSIVIGLFMHLIFRREEAARHRDAAALIAEKGRPLVQSASLLGVMAAILVFATWGKPLGPTGWVAAAYSAKWFVVGLLAALLGWCLIAWYSVKPWKVALVAAVVGPLALLLKVPSAEAALTVVSLCTGCGFQPIFLLGMVGLSWALATSGDEASSWLEATWRLAAQILPLLLIGVLAAGFLFGRPGHEGIVPSAWVASMVGGNSLGANFIASFVGALMYFATLTEIPILQGLMGAGMGKGPALALLLAGPALSLPSMLVLNSILGLKKTAVYVALVVILSTFSGLLFGAIA